MRDYTPSPTCEKCGTKFELAKWPHNILVTTNTSEPACKWHMPQAHDLAEGDEECLSIVCPICNYPFDMHTADHQPERVQDAFRPE